MISFLDAHIELGHTFTIYFIHNFFEIPKMLFSVYLFIIKAIFCFFGIFLPFINSLGQLIIKLYEFLWNLYVKMLRFVVDIIFNGLNRYQEKEADLRAIQLTKHLGIIEFFKWLSQFEEDDEGINVRLGSHPKSNKRIEYCTQEARLLELIFNLPTP